MSDEDDDAPDPKRRQTGDPEAVKRDAAKHKLERKRELEDLRAVLETKEGRRLLWRIVSRCNPYSSIRHTNALVMSAMAGERDLATWIIREIITADKAYWLTMQQESL